MKKMSLFATAVLLFMAVKVVAAVELSTDQQKLSYALGVYFSQSVIQQHSDLNKESFIQAINDVFEQRKLKLTEEEMRNLFTDYHREQQKQEQAMTEKNKAMGEKFLNENKNKKGVVELPSGLQYTVLEKGSGAKVKPGSTVSVHYRGTLIDGSEFDSSYSRGQPATFQLDQVIEGWQQALPLMQVGAKWKIYVPYTLAYGERGAGGMIGPYSALIFDIELLETR